MCEGILIKEEESNGFIIRTYTLPEYEQLNMLFPEMEKEEIDKLYIDLELGKYVLSTYKVSAWTKEEYIDYGTYNKLYQIELSSEYLGGCLYESHDDFIENSDYYDDMKNTVISESKIIIKSLNKYILEGE